MANAFEFKRLRRSLIVYGVAQVVLICLLIVMAVYFQAGLQLKQPPNLFLKSVLVTVLIQMALFYPLNKYAASEAKREVESCDTGLTPEQLKKFRNKRVMGDVIKSAFLLFFLTFIWRVPPNLFMYSLILFAFILTSLCYLQCFNFAAKRLMKENQPEIKG